MGLPVVRLGLEHQGLSPHHRPIATETPIAFEYNGIAYAVMMASPEDLHDFAIGFTLSEGLVAKADEIEHIAMAEIASGWIMRIQLTKKQAEPLARRVRMRVAEGSCGLCGLESIEEVLRPLPPITARIRLTRSALAHALAGLEAHQPDGRLTGALHAAAFCAQDGAIVMAREDVGRHNALDKLIGALASAGVDARNGFFLLSARCSYELVEKTVRAGCPALVTISAPTTLAIERARMAGLTLLALARPDSVLICHDPHAIFLSEEQPDDI